MQSFLIKNFFYSCCTYSSSRFLVCCNHIWHCGPAAADAPKTLNVIRPSTVPSHLQLGMLTILLPLKKNNALGFRRHGPPSVTISSQMAWLRPRLISILAGKLSMYIYQTWTWHILTKFVVQNLKYVQGSSSKSSLFLPQCTAQAVSTRSGC